MQTPYLLKRRVFYFILFLNIKSDRKIFGKIYGGIYEGVAAPQGEHKT